jgi:hypothetical protein
MNVWVATRKQDDEIIVIGYYKSLEGAMLGCEGYVDGRAEYPLRWERSRAPGLLVSIFGTVGNETTWLYRIVKEYVSE